MVSPPPVKKKQERKTRNTNTHIHTELAMQTRQGGKTKKKLNYLGASCAIVVSVVVMDAELGQGINPCVLQKQFEKQPGSAH